MSYLIYIATREREQTSDGCSRSISREALVPDWLDLDHETSSQRLSVFSRPSHYVVVHCKERFDLAYLPLGYLVNTTD